MTLQRTVSFCGPCELVEISKDEGLSAGPLLCLSTEPVTQPFLQVTNTTVKELDSVTLTCLSKDRQAHIHWIFNNDTLLITEKMTTSQAGLILKIDPIKREDAGEYQCEISNPVSVKRSNSIKLEVICEWPCHPSYYRVLTVGAIYQGCAKWVKVSRRKIHLKIQIQPPWRWIQVNSQ